MKENLKAIRTVLLIIGMISTIHYQGAAEGILFCIAILLIEILETLKGMKQ